MVHDVAAHSCPGGHRVRIDSGTHNQRPGGQPISRDGSCPTSRKVMASTDLLCDHFITTSPEGYVQDAGITSAASEQNTAGARPASMALLEGWTALTATRHHAHPSGHQRAVQLVPSSLGAGQDGSHVGRYLRGTTRAGFGSRVVQAWNSRPTESRFRRRENGSPHSARGLAS